MPNLALITRPFEWKEAIASNRIEGTYTEPMTVLLNDAGRVPTDPRSAADVEEVRRYFEAYGMGREMLAKGQPFSSFLVRALHEELLQGVRGAERNPGAVREVPIFIGDQGDGVSDARFVPPPPEHVGPLLDNWTAYMVEGARITPLIDAAIQHYQFEAIHPFEDGNGRLGRLLILLYFAREGLLERPVLYLSSYFEEHRDAYAALLKGVSTRGEWDAWVAFFLDAVESQARDASDRIEKVLALQDDFRDRVKVLRSRAAMPAVDLVLERVVVTTRMLANYANVHFQTAQTALQELSRLGIVTPVDDSYPQAWASHELIEEVYA